MKFAISTDGEDVSAHFGRCPSFTIVQLENGKILSREKIDNPGHHPGYLPQFFSEMGVKCIIAGGVGRKAEWFFNEKGMEVIVGVTGSIEEVIEKLSKGELKSGESICKPGRGKGYGLEKEERDHF